MPEKISSWHEDCFKKREGETLMTLGWRRKIRTRKLALHVHGDGRCARQGHVETENGTDDDD
jgi:hypothetical protein